MAPQEPFGRNEVLSALCSPVSGEVERFPCTCCCGDRAWLHLIIHPKTQWKKVLRSMPGGLTDSCLCWQQGPLGLTSSDSAAEVCKACLGD